MVRIKTNTKADPVYITWFVGIAGGVIITLIFDLLLR